MKKINMTSTEFMTNTHIMPRETIPPLLVSSCDLYEDAWNPFFRLLQKFWPDSPRKVYLVTESKTYTDEFFQIQCIHCDNKFWSNRIINALNAINEDYIWFFLEDFFLEDNVNSKIIQSALHLISHEEKIGVIKFIPNISSGWFDSTVNFGEYFNQSSTKNKKCNLMLSLYNK